MPIFDRYLFADYSGGRENHRAQGSIRLYRCIGNGEPERLVHTVINRQTGQPQNSSRDSLAKESYLNLQRDAAKTPIPRKETNKVNTLDAIHSRRSIRKYLDKPVLPDVFQQVLSAAMYARVWGSNQQRPLSQAFSVTVPPGQSAFVELVLQNP